MITPEDRNEIVAKIKDQHMPVLFQATFWTAFVECCKNEYLHRYQIERTFVALAQRITPAHFKPSPLRTTVGSLVSEDQFVSEALWYVPDFAKLPLYHPIPETLRFQSTHLLAPSGEGKSTLLENLVAHDMETKVRPGHACVVVMDSQGKHELIGRLQSTFPHKLISSDTPMNLFALPRRGHTQREQEIIQSNAIDLITYTFSSVLGESGELTSRQRGMWEPLVQLVLAANGSIQDMIDLTKPYKKDVVPLDPYRQYIPKLSPNLRDYFNHTFPSKDVADIKEGLRWRLQAVIARPAMERMLTQQGTIDLYSELLKPQLILVHTDETLLGEHGTEVFGRIIIANLNSIIRQRLEVPAEYRFPIYVYIDECMDYIHSDPQVEKIIDKARKAKIAFLFSYQRKARIRDPRVLAALEAAAIQIIQAGAKYHFTYASDRSLPVVVTCPPVKPEPQPKPTVVPNTVTPYIYEGEALPPEEPQKALPRSKWGEDDVDLG